MFGYFKARKTYLIFGGSCIGIGLLYAILHYAWLRNVPRVQEEEEEAISVGEGIADIGAWWSSFATANPNAIRFFAEVSALPRRPSLGHALSRKEERDIEDMAKFEAFTPLGMTFSGRSVNSSVRSNDSSRNQHLRQSL